jgi:cation diffusion facilitator family transporter
MMVLEITVGLLSHSMALLADGWHMSTHVTAFLITAAAYYFTKRHASNLRFSFGTGKIGVLGGFASAVVLSVVALLMAGESVHRIFVPLSIHFDEAIGIACLGLVANLGCAILLKDDHACAWASSSAPRPELTCRLSARPGGRFHVNARHRRADFGKVFRLDLARPGGRNCWQCGGVFLGL